MSGGGGGGGGDWRPIPTPIAPKKPSGGGDGGGGGGNESDPCDIVEITNLNSVDATVLATLALGAVLDVVYVAGPPARLLAQSSGATLGSITSPHMPQLVQCITQGHAYEAEILLIRGGICQVEIRRI